MFVLSLYVLAQLDRKHEHLVALGTFVTLIHPVVPQLMDTLCAVGIEQPSADFAWIDSGSRVHSIYMAAQIKLGRHQNSTKPTLPFLSTCSDNKNICLYTTICIKKIGCCPSPPDVRSC